MSTIRQPMSDTPKISDKSKAFVQEEFDANYLDVRQIFTPQYALSYFGRKETLEFLLAEERTRSKTN